MSKRFGRNQRRKLLAQRDAFDKLASQMQSEWIARGNEIHRLIQGIEDWNDRIVDMLDRTSAFLSEPAQRKVRELQRFLRVEKRYDMSKISPHEGPMANTFTAQQVFLNFLSVMAEEDLMTLRKINLLIQELPNGQRVFSRSDLSMVNLRQNTDYDQLAYYVSRELVRVWKAGPPK